MSCSSSPTLPERYRGALLGLATGDAVGTTLEFKSPGSFTPITDMVGGGPFHLQPGEWTDDTTMALCLAESLVERQGFDAHDQMERYVAWMRHGKFSVKGYCFDIGNTTAVSVSLCVFALKQRDARMREACGARRKACGENMFRKARDMQAAKVG